MSKIAEDFDHDLRQLLAAINTPLKHEGDVYRHIIQVANWIKSVQEAADVMQVWIDEANGDDPRANGWVGQDGRP